MRGVNKVILLGTLGRDPETRTFAGGGSITTVSLATSEQWKDKVTGESKEQTEWHRVVFSNRLAEIAAEYLRKGSKVYVEGKLTTRKWTDKDGQKKERTEWHRVVVWGKLGELCGQYLSKGRQAFVEGRIQTRDWTDKDGNKRYTTEVIAQNIQFLGGAGERPSAGSSDFAPGPNDFAPPPGNVVDASDSSGDDEVPF